ncbi:thioredoxin domain-containing protein [Methanolobus sp. ZRKC2]|uniref:thioredoxin family protein n=1 Tax=Methanolobus sp. ZRKC2 TaxID=3125783 RepID=UPI0032438586
MSKPELLDFSATWCGPCKMQKPILDKVKEELGDKVDVKVIDVDQNQDMARKYGVQAVPTLVILKDGEPVKRFTGVTTAGVLIEELNKVL